MTAAEVMILENRDPMRQYIKALERRLIMPRNKKKDFLAGIIQELQDYISVHPDCTYLMLESDFGKPQIVADQFIENSNLFEVIRKFKQKRLIAYLSVIGLVIVIIFLGVWIHAMLSETQVRVTQTITHQSTTIVDN
jgi:hypothetical protein